MEAFGKLAMVALVLATLLGNEVMVSEAQICNITRAGLMACKPSVSGTNPVPPSDLCCLALSHADMHCLCYYKSSNLLSVFGVDPNLAMELPEKCNLSQTIKC